MIARGMDFTVVTMIPALRAKRGSWQMGIEPVSRTLAEGLLRASIIDQKRALTLAGTRIAMGLANSRDFEASASA